MTSLDGKRLKRVIDPTVAKAFSHPLRGHVWVKLFERGELSPREVADELGLEASDVSYHFRKLKRRRLIRLVRTVQRRGFEEHFYEPISPALFFEDAEWMELPTEIRTTFSGEMLRQIIGDLKEALVVGSFDSRDRHLSQSWLLLDDEGWRELMRAMKAALDRFIEIQERSAVRRSLSKKPGVPVSLVLASFETAESVSKHQSGQIDLI